MKRLGVLILCLLLPVCGGGSASPPPTSQATTSTSPTFRCLHTVAGTDEANRGSAAFNAAEAHFAARDFSTAAADARESAGHYVKLSVALGADPQISAAALRVSNGLNDMSVALDGGNLDDVETALGDVNKAFAAMNQAITNTTLPRCGD